MDTNEYNNNTAGPTTPQAFNQSAPQYGPTVAGHNKVLLVISDAFSGLFLPLLTPIYVYVMALWITPLSAVSEKMRLISSIIVFVITCVPPLATILCLMRKGKVSDVSISNPKERTAPYVVTILSYLAAAFYLIKLPKFMPMFFVGAAIAAAIALIINFKWKISAHATSMGGLCAMLLYIGIHHYAVVMIMPWICGGILCSGLVGSARIYLGRHTPAQVYCGWLLGLTVAFAAMSI